MAFKWLVKYEQGDSKHSILNPAVDSVDINGVIFGLGSNIVITSLLQSVSSSLYASLVSVSSTLYGELVSVSSALHAEMFSVSSTLYADLVSVSSTLHAEMVSVSSTIQAQISSPPKEERLEYGGGPATFTVSQFDFDPSPTVRDIQIWKNGLRTYGSLNGTVSGLVSGGDWFKLNTTQFQWLGVITLGDRLIVRKERVL